MTSWQRRRTALSHDWLKNRYLPALASWGNVLDGKIQDPALEASFEAEILAQWEVRRVEALALVNDFPIEMSPRTLVEHGLALKDGLQLQPILADCIHELWMFRNHVAKRVRVATARVKAADLAYGRMRAKLKDHSSTDNLSAWQDVRSEFEAFAKHCRRLGRSLTRLQDEITLV